MSSLRFSVVVPVYNRPLEVCELLESLQKQSYGNFEVIIVEDGSDQRCESIVDGFRKHLELHYFYKHNTGPGDSRNFGSTHASGDYLIFFDSDCQVPADYLNQVAIHLKNHPLDVYGGPDRAHADFSNIQKAINYSMTSFLTTGGIRGHQRAAKTFQPRSFNMGMSTGAFKRITGFSDLHPGEDPDLVYRLTEIGYKTGLIPHAFVYHKRRIDLRQFSSQVFKFGLARTILIKWHPASKRLVFALPTIATAVFILMLGLGILNSVLWYVLGLGLLVLFLDALRSTGNPIIAGLGTIASLVQVTSYGWGFMTGWWQLHVLGKDERSQFPAMFFKK